MGDEPLLTDGDEKIIDNLEAHVADLYHAEKSKLDGDK